MNETVSPEKVEVAQPAKPTAPNKHRWGKAALALALALAAIVAWRHFENPTPSTTAATGPVVPSGGPPQTVRTAAAVNGDMPITIDALGVVTPLASVTVKTQIAGKLMTVGFEEGQLVKAGDFLAQIDPRPYQAALALAQGQLEKDSALYAQAQSDLARYQTLSKQDSIARQQVEDQVFLVAQDKAAMAADQAQIDTANLNIGYCHIVAPVSGRVGLRLVDPGNYLQPSDANGIVVITQLDPISVVFSTPEDNLPQIAARLNSGAKLPVAAFDRANVKQLAMGTLTTFDNQIDVTTGTFKLRATFANPDGALFPNQFVNVRLLVDTLSGAVLAPNAAVQLGASGSFVYVVKDDSTVAVRPVATGPADATNTTIVSGLTAGENVVIDGADRLRDGAKVSVRNSAAAAQNQAPAGAGGPGQGQHRRQQAPDAGGAPQPTASPAQ
ncbi:MAG: MdtA/MuxA family multidrug efflux RND transporter periplasmic adaptor subunit [Roseiarcus sp.]|jgi:multidrug efflux system membrane fusion protein